MILPRYITATRSAMWRTTERSWAMNTYASPRRSCSSSRRLITPAWMDTSRADTGSSRTSTAGQKAGRCGLAAPRLAHQAQGLALTHVEREAADGVDLVDDPAQEPGPHREVLDQVAHLEDRLPLAGGDGPPGLGVLGDRSGLGDVGHVVTAGRMSSGLTFATSSAKWQAATCSSSSRARSSGRSVLQ